MDRRVVLLVAQGYEDDEIVDKAHVTLAAIDSVLRDFRVRVRHHLQPVIGQRITRLELALYVLQHIITRDEQEAWTAEAEAAIKLLTDYSLLNERALLVATRAAEPRNFGLEYAALARAMGKYNAKLIQQILRPLWEALGCSPIRLRTIFYLIARRDEKKQTRAGAYA